MIAAGRAPDTPVVIAVDVSLPTERIIRGRLGAFAFLVRAIGHDDPTLLLVGEAVAGARPIAAAMNEAAREPAGRLTPL